MEPFAPRELRPGEVWWTAVRYGDRPLGRVPCIPDAEIALLTARLMWGSAVLYVYRSVAEDDDSDKDCA